MMLNIGSGIRYIAAAAMMFTCIGFRDAPGHTSYSVAPVRSVRTQPMVFRKQ